MLGNRTSEEWVAQYASSHQNHINRVCHTIGIPMIAMSLLLFIAAIFIGHYYEGKPPEFFHDWRFLFVGLRWWFAKIRGRA
jgi:uncharacterized membrane protein YGL010W